LKIEDKENANGSEEDTYRSPINRSKIKINKRSWRRALAIDCDGYKENYRQKDSAMLHGGGSKEVELKQAKTIAVSYDCQDIPDWRGFL
jgi:hypothetical protein